MYLSRIRLQTAIREMVRGGSLTRRSLRVHVGQPGPHGAQKPILVLLQCLLLALYLILLSVLYLIQLGRALFDFIMWPILTFLRSVLIDPISILYLKYFI